MLLEELNDRQQQVVKKLSDKIVFPNMTPAKEIALLNRMYDGVEDVLTTLVDAI